MCVMCHEAQCPLCWASSPLAHPFNLSFTLRIKFNCLPLAELRLFLPSK